MEAVSYVASLSEATASSAPHPVCVPGVTRVRTSMLEIVMSVGSTASSQLSVFSVLLQQNHYVLSARPTSL